MSDRLRWMKFWPADWSRDPALRMCGLAARGLWIELIGLMHEANPYGHLLVNGRPISAKQIAAIVGSSPDEVSDLLAELEEAGVFSRTDEGVIFSRRMIRDHDRAEDGREAVKRRWAKKGGTVTPGGTPNTPPNRSPNTDPNRESRRVPNSLEAEAEAEREGVLRTPPRARACKEDPLFAEFYAAYPRKDQPDDALKAYQQVRKAGATHDDLMAGLGRYRFNDEARFIPMPATWLRKGCWKSEGMPAPRPQQHGQQQSAPPKFKNPFLARQYAEMQRQQDQDDDTPPQPLRLI